MNGATATTSLSLDSLRQRLRRLNLFGLLAHAEQILAEPWLERVLHIEESERQQRSLKRRLANTRLGSFKPLADFDYGWPTELDRALLDELFTLSFLEQAANIVIVGPNGLGKTTKSAGWVSEVCIRRSCAATARASPSPPTCCTNWPLKTAPHNSRVGYAVTPLRASFAWMR